MKIREDFVTNSSSSSFVIGKKDDETVTIDSVYRLIRGFYREYLLKRNEAVKYISEHPELGLIYKRSSSDTYEGFYPKEGRTWDDNNKKAFAILNEKFDMSSYDYFKTNYDWMACETYKEYEEYWLNQANLDADFTIADFFEEKEIYMLHYRKTKEIHKVDSTSDTLGWYFPYAEEAFDINHNCDNCHSKDWCDPIDKQECEEGKATIRGKDVPESHACLYLLGRICIHSESGYIPEFVVDRLEKVSEYSCNHMG